jgi:hypothetical protein
VPFPKETSVAPARAAVLRKFAGHPKYSETLVHVKRTLAVGNCRSPKADYTGVAFFQRETPVKQRTRVLPERLRFGV